MNKRNYIGLSTTPHDSALAVVDSRGEVVFAEGTERYLQNKRAIGSPPDLLRRTAEIITRYCEPGSELVAAFSWSERREASMRRMLEGLDRAQVMLERQFTTPPAFACEGVQTGRYMTLAHLGMDLMSGAALDFEAARVWGARYTGISKRRYDHHLAHAATAAFTSPFEEAVCAIVDGYGEDTSCDFYHYHNGKLERLSHSPPSSHAGLAASLGMFYEEICRTCGFDSTSGEEWKVMGLAAYGRHDERLYHLLRSLFVVDGLQLGTVTEGRQFAIWRELYHMRRKKGEPALQAANIAFTAQEVFTDVLCELLNNLRSLSLSENLVFGGGCALNSSANGCILNRTGFRNLHVSCAPADDGNAVGAALLAYREDHPELPAPARFQSPYLGSTMSGETLSNLMRFSEIPTLVDCKGGAPERAAWLLAEGKIVGWVQGRAEFGPRALGNRSILADPRSPCIKEEINSRVKFREEFRPFAPSILHEFGPQYFETYQESPYMERTLRFRPEIARRVPGVVHEDGTGRLQTVKKEWNERYYRLIQRFYELTDIPLVLNTSFNVMGKPIAHSVEDVIAVFYTSGLDAVFIDDIMIEK